MKITVIDYGAGNLYSIRNAFQYCGQEVCVSGIPKEISKSDALVLPGVGAFGPAIMRLRELGIHRVLRSFAKQDKPILGICLGMQLLTEGSEEFGGHDGLDIIKGEVKSFHGFEKFAESSKVPHIGWNTIKVIKETQILEGIESKAMYFNHSFCFAKGDMDNILATCEYRGVEFAAVIGRGVIFGCQFHPEKSSKSGLRIIENFIKISRGAYE